MDRILKLYIEENISINDIAAQGFPQDIVARITGMVVRNEYKRAQCPPVIKISKKAFGNGRKFPF